MVFGVTGSCSDTIQWVERTRTFCGSEEIAGSWELEELRIEVEELHGPTNDANTIANHAFGDVIAIEQQ